MILRTFLLASLATALLAQEPRGGLVGTVQDPSGASIPRASVTADAQALHWRISATCDARGQFRFANLSPGLYRVSISAAGFETAQYQVAVDVSATPTMQVKLSVRGTSTVLPVITDTLETTTNTQKTTVTRRQIENLPLANRSFANLAYLAPTALPVEPSDPTKARITAMSFGGSSGLNVDLSVDGGDNNDDYIGGALQNYSPDAMQEFSIRTAQFDADTSRTNGGSVVIATRRGEDQWHGGAAVYLREGRWNARNEIDNPFPDPKQPFSRRNFMGSAGGPLRKGNVWLFSSLEYVQENASIAYSSNTSSEFQALASLSELHLIPGVTDISIPQSVPVPFRDLIFSTRVDWDQSALSHWFARGSFDRNQTHNDLIQQATLPSAGATNRTRAESLLLSNQFAIGPHWAASLVLQASGFHNTKQRNSQLGLALAFPFSSNVLTTSGLETYGDNQFATAITAFPIDRNQQKYQLRYDVEHIEAAHSVKFGINVIHEPVLNATLASGAETLYSFPSNPSYYLQNPDAYVPDLQSGVSVTEAQNGAVHQSVRRAGLYVQDSWRIVPHVTLNAGVRYDTTFGLFDANGATQSRNPGLLQLRALGVPFAQGLPRDYRKALAPRLGLAYAPGTSGRTVIRAGFGLYYNDLAQNGWIEAFQAVNQTGPVQQAAVIDPKYKTPYALQATAAVEHAFGQWNASAEYQHEQGLHQYRRYEYAAGVNLPEGAPNASVFRSDNRSAYDAVSFTLRHRFTRSFDVNAHYTLAHATTYGATVGELFDYVNGVSNARQAFGPGDHGPSGEDVRHRVVISGSWRLPWHLQVSGLSQFESARPFTLTTPVDVNGDGIATNDRAVINGRQTTLDQFRGSPFRQIDVRVTREFSFGEDTRLLLFGECFNLLNRQNAGNNYASSLAQLPIPASEYANLRHACVDAGCTSLRPLEARDLLIPAGALGDFFGPGTTVGMPRAAQLGLRLVF
jgi:outer membrane receptor protein involved in Fe transport